MGTQELNTQYSEDEVINLMTNFKNHFNLEKVSGGFIGIDLLQQFFGIPNFQGISLYNGFTNDGQLAAILVGVTEVNGKPHNVFNYVFSVDNARFTQTKPIRPPIVVVALKQPPPCPPLPPGQERC